MLCGHPVRVAAASSQRLVHLLQEQPPADSNLSGVPDGSLVRTATGAGCGSWMPNNRVTPISSMPMTPTAIPRMLSAAVPAARLPTSACQPMMRAPASAAAGPNGTRWRGKTTALSWETSGGMCPSWCGGCPFGQSAGRTTAGRCPNGEVTSGGRVCNAKQPHQQVVRLLHVC